MRAFFFFLIKTRKKRILHEWSNLEANLLVKNSGFPLLSWSHWNLLDWISKIEIKRNLSENYEKPRRNLEKSWLKFHKNTEDIFWKFWENLAEILRKLYGNFEKILLKYWEIFIKFMRKGDEILRKFKENITKILWKFCEKFHRKFVGILRNFYINFEKFCCNLKEGL